MNILEAELIEHLHKSFLFPANANMWIYALGSFSLNECVRGVKWRPLQAVGRGGGWRLWLSWPYIQTKINRKSAHGLD